MLSILLTSCLTAFKTMLFNIVEQFMRGDGDVSRTPSYCEYILTHTSNTKCFRNVTLINIRGLVEIIVRSCVMAGIHQFRVMIKRE